MSKELFELERGDTEKLEGRAIIYCKVNEPNQFNNICPAMYVGNNPFDLFSPEERESFVSNSPGFFNDEKGLKLSIVIRPLLENPLEFMQRDGDVLNLGQFTKLEYAQTGMFASAQVYMMKYLSQWEERMINKNNNHIEVENLNEYDSQKLQHRLYTLMSELMDGMRNSDFKTVERVKKTLTSFGSKSNCRSALEKLVEFAGRTGPNQILLTERQIEMIIAIKSGQFEKAGELRDEIKTLYKSK